VAQAFDESTGTLRDQPRPVLADVAFNSANGRAAFAVSQAGSLVFRSGTAPRGDRLIWLSRDGVELQQVGDESRREFGRVALAPDESRAVVQVIDSERSRATGDLWTYDLDRGTRIRFTTDPGLEWAPVWSADGRVAYSVASSPEDSRTGSTLWIKSPGGTEPARKVAVDEPVTNASAWTADGSHLVVETSTRESGTDIWLAR
jgi:Tol biopolymer transport system component